MSRPVTRSRTCGTPSTSPGATTGTPAETTPPTGTSTMTGMRESSSPAAEKRTKNPGKYRQYSYHSEQQGGAFLVDQLKAKNILKLIEVYTERSPCNITSQQCGA